MLKPKNKLLLLLAFSVLVFGLVWQWWGQGVSAAEELNLKIGHQSYYNGQANATSSWTLADLDDGLGPNNGDYLFFNLTNLLPGDTEHGPISLEATGTDVWACYDLTVNENDDAGCSEPELLADPTCDATPDIYDGELGESIHLALWPDDGDGVFETDETLLYQGSLTQAADSNQILADINQNIFTDTTNQPLNQTTNYYLGKSLCFGELTPHPAIPSISHNPEKTPGFTCDGSQITDATQTDRLLGELKFWAVQADVNPEFTCGTCAINGSYGADIVESFSQGLRKDGSAVPDNRSNPSSLLGLPQGTNATGTFFSLGLNGEVIVALANPVEDLPGIDLSIREVTGGTNYPEERAEISVSQDGQTYHSLGQLSSLDGPIINFDINGQLAWFRYIRIIDTTDQTIHPTNVDGIDIDGLIVTNQNICLE